MNEPPATFQSLAHRLRYITLQDFLSSDRYRDASRLFEASLLLADRIVRACEQDIELGRAAEIRDVLSALRQSTNDEVVLPSEKLELWLKALVRLAAPDKYEQRKRADEGKSTRRFNLFACLEDLNLAETEELNLSGARILYVADRITQSIWFAKYDRNNATHDTGLPDFTLRARITNGMCTAMLAPVILHFEALRRSLRTLITTDPSFGIAHGTNRMVDSERRGHLSRFKGREDDTHDILRSLENAPDGGYLLVTAEEGTGKSALCATISERLRPRGNTLGATAAKSVREMPWLPGAVIHFGKSARDPETITAFLIAQVNCMTLAEVSPPAIASDGGGEEGDEDVSLETSEYPAPAPPKHDANTFSPRASITKRRRPAVRSEQMRKCVFAALDALAQERGDAVLVIDALDEISEDGSALGFLPPRLPAGVSALITSRANTNAVRWALEHLHIARHVTLQHLRREDMPAISGVPDTTPQGRAFNDDLHADSDGLPLIAHRLMDTVSNTDTGLTRQRLTGGAAAVFRRQAQAWTSRGPIAKEALIALGLFEPIGSLSLELLQCYLAKVIDKVPDLADLRDVLEPVANQVQGFEEGSLKLASRPFAVYVHDEHFSKLDLVRPLTALRSVLAEESSVGASKLAGFLEFWGHTSRDARHRSLAMELVDDLTIAGDSDRLLGIAHYFKVWESTANVYGLRCLQQAAWLEQPTALRVLGLITLDGGRLPADPAEGRRLLERASQKGDDRSLLILGDRLLDGRGLPESPEEGLQMLERAVEKNVEQAPMALGMRLLFGERVQKDSRRGAELLEQAATAGNEMAMFTLGHFMLDGRLIEKNAAKGREWLIRAAEQGHTGAMEELAGRLLDGADVEPDAVSARAWYEKSIQLGSPSAMTRLAERLFEGEELPQDLNVARDLLIRAAETGDARSMGVLGRRMLKGDGFPLDLASGVKWLEKAARDGDVGAAVMLTEVHVQRLSDVATRAESEEWIQEVIERESHEMLIHLGQILYRANEHPLAARSFRRAAAQEPSVGNNVFYMLRRHEAQAVEDDGDPHAFVDALVVQKRGFALVNKALALAAGFACGVDWHAADRLIMDVPSIEVDDLVSWWHDLAKRSDAEGHLVLGWLTQHGKTVDPDGWPARRRFSEAIRSGWSVPDWVVGTAQA